MDWIKNWSESIVISIIIATIVEMLLPNNTSKKYIKIVVGVFVVYNIIYPIISTFTTENIEQSLDVNEIIQASSSSVSGYNNINQSTESSIKKIYVQNLEKNLATSLKNKGYDVGNLTIKVSNDDSYNIEKIDLQVNGKIQNNQEEKEVYSIVDTIKYVNINISNENQPNNEMLNESDKDTIKKHIEEIYEVSSDKINVY